MSKSFFSLFISFVILLQSSIFVQDSNSIQINGGIVMPMSSSKGLTGTIQFNYSLTSAIKIYIYTGYSTWDQYKVTFIEDYSVIQKETIFQSYSADDHKLIPFYVGSRMNFHTNKLFTSFISCEIGYSYLSYNSYKNWKSVNPETGEVQGYFADGITRTKIDEKLFGIGMGVGIFHTLSENLNLVLSYKLNSHINSGYNGLFSKRGTYSQFLAGFGFSI
jgi:hypothetical protein